MKTERDRSKWPIWYIGKFGRIYYPPTQTSHHDPYDFIIMGIRFYEPFYKMRYGN
jgi:hypothetical protein